MKLMLDVPGINLPFKIGYRDRIMFVGSCFSEEIANRMDALKFSVFRNPNGIIYDPLSICRSIDSCISNSQYTEEDLFFLDELWHSWQHHSSFSGAEKSKVLQHINSTQRNAHDFLEQATLLIITLGTSYSYSLQSGINVANCHKAPSSSFLKQLITVEEQVTTITRSIHNLRKFNHRINILLTVSPVMHIKDGIPENTRSKARLIETAHILTESMEHTFYFPSFEIMTAVLRDYRFYKEDLVHPSSIATEFIFETFLDAMFNSQDKPVLEGMKKLSAAKSHKPFHPSRVAHSGFRQNHLLMARSLQEKYPFLNLEEEIMYFS